MKRSKKRSIVSRANRRKAKHAAKHRRQRARAG
jgi:hypothetical protein